MLRSHLSEASDTLWCLHCVSLLLITHCCCCHWHIFLLSAACISIQEWLRLINNNSTVITSGITQPCRTGNIYDPLLLPKHNNVLWQGAYHFQCRLDSGQHWRSFLLIVYMWTRPRCGRQWGLHLRRITRDKWDEMMRDEMIEILNTDISAISSFPSNHIVELSFFSPLFSVLVYVRVFVRLSPLLSHRWSSPHLLTIR